METNNSNTDEQMQRRLDNKIEDARFEGFEVERRLDDRVHMINRQYGNLVLHLILLVFTVGIGNLIYIVWSNYRNPKRRVVRVYED
jgi:hypothetical protein